MRNDTVPLEENSSVTRTTDTSESRTTSGGRWKEGFGDAVQIQLELTDSVGMGVDAERQNEIMYTSLEERIRYKRRNYSEIIDAVVEAGNWDSELL